MPANLSVQYKEAEAEYKKAKDPQAKLACLESMLSLIPKHKGTEKMQAEIKRKIARLKESLQKSSKGKKGFSVSVDKEGAAQVVLVGAPNAGKSALIEATTNAKADVADYPFSTKSPCPAMFAFENIQFQLVDLPPISSENMEAWVSDIVRNADAALWVVDAADPDIEQKINETQSVLDSKKIELVGPNTDAAKWQDSIMRLKTLILAAKTDESEAAKGISYLKQNFEGQIDIIEISAMGDDDFTTLALALFELNKIVRVYSKSPGKDPDLSKPFILHQGDCLMDFARMVHKDFAQNLKYARIWGEGKYDGQRVQRNHILSDGDIVELRV
jgi:ribosome-interacting GTPase 1